MDNLYASCFYLVFGEVAAFLSVYCSHFARLYLKREGFSMNVLLFCLGGLVGIQTSLTLLFFVYSFTIEPFVLALLK